MIAKKSLFDPIGKSHAPSGGSRERVQEQSEGSSGNNLRLNRTLQWW
jgi:hypothetical protein